MSKGYIEYMSPAASARFIRRNALSRMFGSFILRQPIQEIEITDAALHLKIEGVWQTASWGEISDAQLRTQAYVTGGQVRAHIRKAEHLLFQWNDRKWIIDVSRNSAHFSNGEKLRELLMKKLQPVRTDMGTVQKSIFIVALAIMGVILFAGIILVGIA